MARRIFLSQDFIEIIRTMIPIQSLYLKKQDVVIRHQSLVVSVARVQYLIGGILLISTHAPNINSIVYALTAHAILI